MSVIGIRPQKCEICNGKGGTVFFCLKNANLTKMENSQSQAAPTAGQILQEFRNAVIDTAEVRDTLMRVFMGFYASGHAEYCDAEDREQISFHFNMLRNLLKQISELSF